MEDLDLLEESALNQTQQDKDFGFDDGVLHQRDEEVELSSQSEAVLDRLYRDIQEKILKGKSANMATEVHGICTLVTKIVILPFIAANRGDDCALIFAGQ